jgi:hypothetical protein
MVRAFARITAATIGAVSEPDARAALAVEITELWCAELKGSLECLAERDAQEGGEPCGS